MLKQTVLKVQGALGFLRFSSKNEENDGDSGNSSGSQRSDDDQEESRGLYTSTCILVPAGQSLNEISLARQTNK